jgi:2'-hydroxyisoflavone reductase
VRILVIGGTAFVGRHIVAAALARDHEVTLFHRGKTGLDLFPDCERILGDRLTQIDRLSGRTWDAAIDVNGRIPGEVRASAKLLQHKVGSYLFVSTVSVYKNWGGKEDEDGETYPALEEPPETMDGASYGGLKAACERVVDEFYPIGSTIVRPGLIVGPYDTTDRFTYWPSRIARGGDILAPGSPERMTQFIDARDLGEWIVSMAAELDAGTYNAVDKPLALGKLFESILAVVGGEGRLVWKDDAFLLRHKVEPWTELPLWIPGADTRFMGGLAREHGLKHRPLEETVRDVWEWDKTRPESEVRLNGLDPAREAELLKSE